jgi:hypothetical protein
MTIFMDIILHVDMSGSLFAYGYLFDIVFGLLFAVRMLICS